MNFSRFSHSFAPIAFQALADLFFLWIIFRNALGGWETAQILLTQIGAPAWIALAVVCSLVLYRAIIARTCHFSSRRTRSAIGRMVGTTRGVWTYWNHATPPDYLPPLWAIGLLTVTRLRLLIKQACAGRLRVSVAATYSRPPKPRHSTSCPRSHSRTVRRAALLFRFKMNSTLLIAGGAVAGLIGALMQ